MSDTSRTPRKSEKPFSFTLFIPLWSIQTALPLLVTVFCFPRTLSASLLSFVLVSVSCLALNALFEYTFHMLFLHIPIFERLRYLYDDHSNHHARTNVLPFKPGGEPRPFVDRYPIQEPRQHQSSFFPYLSQTKFKAFFSVLFIPLQLLFPALPILLCGYPILDFSYGSYEVVHAIEHFPRAWWKKRWEGRFGKFWVFVFKHHFLHHFFFPNEGIWRRNYRVVGLLPLDRWFGTYAKLKTERIPEEGEILSVDDIELGKPRRFILWIYAWADRRVARRESARRNRLSATV